MKFSKILIGYAHSFMTLPPPIESLVDIKKDTVEVLIFSYWQVMLPELLCREKYLAVIDARLLCLIGDPANSDQALLLKYCRFFSGSIFILNDPENSWKIRPNAPANLILWKHSSILELRAAIAEHLNDSRNLQ